jgi:hypothetical protein
MNVVGLFIHDLMRGRDLSNHRVKVIATIYEEERLRRFFRHD